METPEERVINDHFAMKVNNRVDQLLEEVESVTSMLSETDDVDWSDLICPVGTLVRTSLNEESLRDADHAFIRVLCGELQTANEEVTRLKNLQSQDRERMDLLVECCSRQRDERDLLVEKLEDVRRVMVEQKETILDLLDHVTRLTDQEQSLRHENDVLDNNVAALLYKVDEHNQEDADWLKARAEYEETLRNQSEQIVQLTSANGNLKSQIALMETLHNQICASLSGLQERVLLFCDEKQRLFSEQLHSAKIAVVEIVDERDELDADDSTDREVLMSVDDIITNIALYIKAMEQRNYITERKITDYRCARIIGGSTVPG